METAAAKPMSTKEANIMNGTDERCRELQDQIDALNAEIESLQEALNEVPPSARPGIRARILALGRQVRVLERQLAECLIPTSNLSIVGIEFTQATQFFHFNGQGSGNAADNSVPLVANKALILRVYVNRTNLPSFPIPASVSGKVSYSSGATSYPDLSPINGPIAATPSATIDRGNANQTLNFLVPAANCTGTLMFTVTAFDPAHAGDPTYSSK